MQDDFVKCELQVGGGRHTCAHRHTRPRHNSQRHGERAQGMSQELSIPLHIKCLSREVLPTGVFNHFLGVTTVHKNESVIGFGFNFL